MARTSSITIAKYGGDCWSRTGCRRKSVTFGQACTQRSHAIIIFTQWSKNGIFDPQGRYIAAISVKFGMVERTAGTLPHADRQT